ncbi:MAG TPA: maleylpyruvate isomerase family mycothiol-dependent enzyme [Actinophytocola sp.]|uniref:maleylpyruvate isomerase family mycothiol-dependent enzyme n=1 Tax=Actinophytocola sp. TaxID=1872138 RepID=UPI002DBFCA9B|nr:maleylpyruvate isomerase family mycothiol-dependent enzyme [Actinophytocola sp.]HEU5471279.1 maleylpyruvate isomerase family mycothiol-dependent enzyme [Actinophytocola sp.]
MEIFDDLEAEYDRLDQVFAGLSAADWVRPSQAAGWSVVDVLLHLAQTEEAVVATVTGTPLQAEVAAPNQDAAGVDEAMDRWVAAERAGPELVYPRWQAARRASVAALRAADPQRVSPWASAPLRPATLATTRLAEHWAHALDITGPLAIPYPDTVRLRHIAWLAHRSLPYAFTLAGVRPAPVRAELTGPDGATWRFGPDDADSVISGPAGAFCRVGAQRLAARDSGLTATGPHGPTALRVLRNYAA